MKKNFLSAKKSFYGSTTLGTKGQVVIPVEARKNMVLKKGEKLLAFGLEDKILVLIKLDKVKDIAKHLSARLSFIEGIMNKENK